MERRCWRSRGSNQVCQRLTRKDTVVCIFGDWNVRNLQVDDLTRIGDVMTYLCSDVVLVAGYISTPQAVHLLQI